MKHPPLIVHLIYRLDFGGLETLLVECINRITSDQYRQAIICLKDYTDFSKKITQPNVELFALNKAPGLGLGTHVKLWKLLVRLKPAILHTYNLPSVEYNFTATLAGVPIRIHAEHGRDASDPCGKNRKHKLLRQFMIYFVHCFVPVSSDLRDWLKNRVHIPDRKIRLIHNGVDTDVFTPDDKKSKNTNQYFVIGSVGRIEDVKNHSGLIDAFIALRSKVTADQAQQLRLVIVGDGPLLPSLKEKIVNSGIESYVTLTGARNDIPELLKTFSVFALSSIAEGTPVVILEAMASGLPVVATRVGGVPEVVNDGNTGMLVDVSDADAFSSALTFYINHPEVAQQHGTAGREFVEKNNSVSAMVAAYMELYNTLYQKIIGTK